MFRCTSQRVRCSPRGVCLFTRHSNTTEDNELRSPHEAATRVWSGGVPCLPLSPRFPDPEGPPDGPPLRCSPEGRGGRRKDLALVPRSRRRAESNAPDAFVVGSVYTSIILISGAQQSTCITFNKYPTDAL